MPRIQKESVMMLARRMAHQQVLLGLVIGWLAGGTPVWGANSDDPQAVAALRNLGAKLEGSPVTKVEFPMGKATDQAMEHLKGVPNLQKLIINGAITDKGFAQLSGLSELRSLTFVKSTIRGRDLVHLKGLTK